MERNIPMQNVVKTFKKKWVTKGALNMVTEKHKSFEKYRTLRTNESKDDCNRDKQMAIYVTKKAGPDFETRIADTIKEDPKEFYSYVNNKTTVRSEILTYILRPLAPPGAQAMHNVSPTSRVLGAILSSYFQFSPVCVMSASRSGRQVFFFGLPLFRRP